jgi:hypothetical protein
VQKGVRVRVMVFHTTLNNISLILWWSVLLVEETGVPGENHRPVTSHWQTLSHNNAQIMQSHFFNNDLGADNQKCLHKLKIHV